MKINYKFKTLTGVALVSSLLFFSSCLKNNQYYLDLSKVAPSLELPLAAAGGNGVNAHTIFTFRQVDTPQTLPVFVNVAAPTALNTPVTATLALDPDWVATYDSANGKGYMVLPDSAYTVSSWNVTVPAGQHLASIDLKINTSKIDLTKSYVIPITIAQASQPISSWKHLMLSIVVKNQYDGTYHATGVFHHPVAGDRNMDLEKVMTTVDGSTVHTTVGDLGGYDLYLHINPDNTVDVSGSVGSNAVKPIVGQPNTYDPATKTFTLNYYYNDAAPRLIDETDTFEHP